MNRRLRLMAALLALVAFSAYLAEGVATLFCAPAVEQVASGHSVDHAGHDGGQHGETQPAPADSPHDPHCPMYLGGATCVAVSLPAAAATVHSVPAAVEDAFARDRTGTALLLIQSLYHPPRA